MGTKFNEWVYRADRRLRGIVRPPVGGLGADRPGGVVIEVEEGGAAGIGEGGGGACGRACEWWGHASNNRHANEGWMI